MGNDTTNNTNQPYSSALNSYECPLDGQSMVSAGAGTGKTYSIQILVLRQILANVPIEKILVVTFTNLATTELQDRIRRILQKALDYCQLQKDGKFETLNAPDKEEFKQVIPCFNGKDVDTCIPLLKTALRNFDFAPISTIHSFCSRTLTDNAFESGLRYQLELKENCNSLKTALISKFYREFSSGHSTNTGKYRALILKLRNITPEWFITKLKPVFDNPGVPINWGYSTDNPHRLQEIENAPQWTRFFEELQNPSATWEEDFHSDAMNFGFTDEENMFNNEPNETAIRFLTRLPSAETVLLYCFHDICEKLEKKNEEILEFLNQGHVFESSLFAAYLNFYFEVPTRNGDSGEKSLNDLLNEYEQILLQEAYQKISDGIVEAKKREGFMTYDDLLIDLNHCVNNGAEGKDLRDILRNQYDCVIIDEFQDTDANQSAIFKALFTNEETDKKPSLFFIGDEKQAIYKFRGGDVQTFQGELERIQNTGHCYTLTDNFRSGEDYIDAMNHFLASTQDAQHQKNFFDDPDIDSPRANIDILEIGKGNRTLERYLLEKDGQTRFQGGNRLLSFQKIDSDVPGEVALEIRALLDSGIQLKREKDDSGVPNPSKVSPKDIAILLRSSLSVNQYRDALKKLGIPSVFLQTQSVFKAHEAQWILTLMDAVADPGNTKKASALLGAPFFGFSILLQDLLNQLCLQDLQAQLKYWNDAWRKTSFYFVFNEFINYDLTQLFPALRKIGNILSTTGKETCPPALRDVFDQYPESSLDNIKEEISRCVQDIGGNRPFPISQRIVNASLDGAHSLAVLMQIAEKLLDIAQSKHLGMETLHTYLGEKVRKAKIDEEKPKTTKKTTKTKTNSKQDNNLTEARVNDDEDDDKEYPIHLTSQDDAVKILTIHKSKGLEFPIVFVPMFGQSLKQDSVYHRDNTRTVNLSEDDPDAKKSCERESVEENRRLMYVAFTRAIYLCRFISKNPSSEREFPEKLLPEVTFSEDFFGRDDTPHTQPPADTPLQIGVFTSPDTGFVRGWRNTSFSNLVKSTEEAQDTNSGDSDAFSSNVAKINLPCSPIPPNMRKPLFLFPNGTATGTCWHEIFEHLDFTLWKAGMDLERWEEHLKSWEEIQRALENYAQLDARGATREELLKAFKEMLWDVCNTKLFQGKFFLCDIPMESTSREFKFTYKIRKDISEEEIQYLNILLKTQENPIAVPLEWSDALLHQHEEHNFTGSIDLLLQSPQDGKFYVLDWKTNILAAEKESFTDDNIQEEINCRFYAFQCVIYTLAFVQYHRQLYHGTNLTPQQREEYARKAYQEFGGCADIFVRGMDRTQADHSVHYTMPSLELILALDKVIGVANSR